MNNYKNHFRSEMKILKEKILKEDGEDDWVCNDFIKKIEEITDIFCKQGHSGMSAPFYSKVLCDTIRNVLSFKPLSPIEITDEFRDVGNNQYQNTRLSSIFKDGKNGKPYYLDAIVWCGEENGDTFTGTVDNIISRQNVKFPFMPKTFYVDVIEDEDGSRHIKDQNQLIEVFEYYDKKEVD